MGEKEYKKTQSKDFLFKVHDGSIKSFVAELCDDSDISREEIEELKKWLMTNDCVGIPMLTGLFRHAIILPDVDMRSVVSEDTQKHIDMFINEKNEVITEIPGQPMILKKP